MGQAEDFVRDITPALHALVARVEPSARLVHVELLGADAAGGAATEKAAGYGWPLRLRLALPGGGERTLVFHTATANAFGHDRRADRAAEMLLGFDTFGGVPRHVPALDVGALCRSAVDLVSLRDAGEFYLVTEYAAGTIYADELRAVAARGRCLETDLARVDALVRVMVEIHAERRSAEAYRRSVRDLVGSGEGIAGIADGYPEGVPGAPRERLERLEAACLAFRFRLRAHEGRCRRLHGDLHPWNVVVSSDPAPTLLDASRGSAGDPADDATCLAVNFLFFALEHPGTWEAGFRPLWRRFWDGYLGATGDHQLLEVAPPYLAWRGLVVGNPAWYPRVEHRERDAMLGFVEASLAAGRLEPDAADGLFR